MSLGNNRKLPSSYRETGAVYSGVYLGIVRANADPQRMGRLAVWVSEFGPDTEEYWVTVSYATPFAGATPVDDNVQDGILLNDTQKSYGWWGTPPDIDNQVLVCFLNGDMAKGFYFASIFAQNMNHMVPGLPFGKSTDPTEDAKFAPYGPPVAEYNKKTSGSSEEVTSTTAQGADTASVRRPVYGPLAEGLLSQGLQHDPERGPSNTSARRESPSRVFGMLTPRGNSIHIDDGFKATPTGEPENEFIRFRTRSGAQILIHETSGYIYMITKGGRSWVEISDGGIDMFSEGSISLATKADFNVTTGGSINFSAGNSLNIKAGSLTSYTADNTNFVSGKDFLVESGADSFIKANKNFGIEASKNVGIDSGMDILMAACGVSSRNAKAILDNSGGGVPDPATRATYVAGEVASRVPQHEPFDHSVSASTGNGDGIGANGQPTQTVVGADGTITNVPVKGNQAAIQKYLYEGFKKRGMTDEGAYTMTAQIGRENDYQERYIYGYHRDAGNGKLNIGMVSWQGSRATKLESLLKSRNLLSGGSMLHGTSAMDAQMDFILQEMKTSAYRKSYTAVTTPGLTYAQIEPVLSGNYEVWDRAGRKIGSARAGSALSKMHNYYAAVKKSNPVGQA